MACLNCSSASWNFSWSASTWGAHVREGYRDWGPHVREGYRDWGPHVLCVTRTLYFYAVPGDCNNREAK